MSGEFLLVVTFALSTLVFFGLWLRSRYRLIEFKLGQSTQEAIFFEKEKAFQSSQKDLERNFQSLALQALNQQSETFLNLATERLDRKTMEAKGLLDEKSLAVQKMVAPVEKTLAQVQVDLAEFERRRMENFGQITEQIRGVIKSSESLQRETQILSGALRRPEVRGSWGEVQLRRLMEIAGMSARCDFSEQVSVEITSETTLKGQLRPDVVVYLPNKRTLVIDSKVILGAFLDYIEATQPELKLKARQRHLALVKTKVRELSQKSYWEQFKESPEFVILFVPNEAALQLALEDEPGLLESAWTSQVIVATSTTLMALMKAVAYGWQQQEVTENAQKIFETTQDLFERLIVWQEHLRKVGSKLGETVSCFNQSVGSLESRVLPSVRKIQQIGIKHRELPEVEFVETQIRDLR